MADNINVRLILELRQANMIAALRYVSIKSAAAIWRRAEAHGVSFADVSDRSEDEVYLLFSPDKFKAETVYTHINYEHIHA